MLKRLLYTLAYIIIFIIDCNVVVNAELIEIEDDHPLLTNPELLQAMEIFMQMSSEERQEVILGLMETVGDDPKKRKEMELLISKLPQVEQEQLLKNPKAAHSLQELIQDDEFAKAKHNAKQMLDGMSWEDFWAIQDQVLESVIAGGQISVEDAALFRTDEEAWKKQLRIIYDDLFLK